MKILGFVENPYPYIVNSTATVLTSLSEGFSLALVESVILDTPIISTEVGVAAELIDNTIQIKRKGGKIKRLPYPEITLNEYELDCYDIPEECPFILRIIKDRVPYEYLVSRRKESDRLIVFNNGAVAEGNVTVPVFQRHSWAGLLKTSSVFCMDPTLYLNGFLQIGWGIGKNENYYLENSSLILKKIIERMNIRPEHTVIFGTSAGGFLSAIMGIYLRGAKVVADNAQLDVRNWIYKDALDSVITFSFDNISDALVYRERFSLADAFEKHRYIPPMFLHVNLCSTADNTTQLVPFLEAAEKMKGIEISHDIKIILHYSPEKGHNGIDMDEAIAFLYQVLGV